ncbi:hypothetical protein [Ralstonia pseudosolanacearum]|nr:hypothetical protein [Ralstonia pseudosolanacearum]
MLDQAKQAGAWASRAISATLAPPICRRLIGSASALARGASHAY